MFGNLDQPVKKIAICPGSGKSVIDVAISKGADVLLTGDIGHHEGIDAVARGLAVIDAGHYGLETCFYKGYVGVAVQTAARSNCYRGKASISVFGDLIYP